MFKDLEASPKVIKYIKALKSWAGSGVQVMWILNNYLDVNVTVTVQNITARPEQHCYHHTVYL